MFNYFRYGLLPIVFFAGMIVVASLDAYSENIARRSGWPVVTATVVEAQDFGALAAARGEAPGKYPNAQGTVRYVVAGQPYEWRGRNRDMGVVSMTPGEQIEVHYNPKDPHEINTLTLLGAGVGAVLFAIAAAFLSFYVWFFWIRKRRPDVVMYDFSDGDLAAPPSAYRPAAPQPIGQGPRTFGSR